MKKDIFEEARQAINENVIMNIFLPVKYKHDHLKNELKMICPYRNDRKIGSFQINLISGYWIDFATNESGDLFDLICKTWNISKVEAAHKILGTGCAVVKYKKKETKEKTYKPVVPIPKEKLQLLTKHINYDIIIEKFGKAISGWKMRMASGEVWMCVARHVKDGSKQDIPYCFNDDGKWHAGWSLNENCPLYGIEKVNPDSKIIITEGLKCADVEVDGRVSISWHGGVNSIDKYDWTPIKDHDCIMWPDLDKQLDNNENLKENEEQPGLKAALIIQNKLSSCQILDVYKMFGTAKPPGWDIFDAKHEDVDLVNFIKECGRYERNKNNYHDSDCRDSMDNVVDLRSNSTIAEFENYIEEDNEDEQNINILDNTDVNRVDNVGNIRSNSVSALPAKIIEVDEDDNAPFKYLGFDDGLHYFLPKGSSIVKKIKFGSFTVGKLLELASLSFWEMTYPKPKGGFYLESAMDDIIRQSEYRGYYDPEKIRGAGIWLDTDRIIVNNGSKLYDENGNRLKDLKTKYHYVISNKNMGDFTGPASTDQQGNDLMNLFTSQGFENDIEALITLGWALIAPLAGLLKWRPHIWITGPKSSGKSWLLENLVHPLTGPFSIIGSGADSGPGLCRLIERDPCPVIKDEMEAGDNKGALERIKDTLDIARNASSDISSHKTVANQNGGVTKFSVRSCFCFSSIMPYLPNDAIESRVLICRIKNSKLTKDKFKNTKKIIATGLMTDPGIFRRRMFKNIRSFLANIEIIEKHLLKKLGDVRPSNNLAPIFAALYTLVNEGIIEDENKINSYIELITSEIEETIDQSDEDKLIRAIFDHQLRTNNNEIISIAELILEGEEDRGKEEYKQLLQRNGVKIYVHGRDRIKYLAIAINTNPVKLILKNTGFEARYVSVLERHPAAIVKDKTKDGTRHRRTRFGALSKDAVHLIWSEIKKKYFDNVEENNPIIENLIDTF